MPCLTSIVQELQKQVELILQKSSVPVELLQKSSVTLEPHTPPRPASSSSSQRSSSDTDVELEMVSIFL